MITPAPLFHHRAVLQRDIPLPVWGGNAQPGAQITAQIATARAQTTANADGSWFLRLPPLDAGGPHELILREEGGTPVVIRDVLVGDVWVCSGQSNMEFLLSQVDPTGEQSAGQQHAKIRLLTVSTPSRPDRQTALFGEWLPCDPETLAAFSAVGGWFGRILHAELGVPIGLIANAWGGTRIQAWMSREALVRLPETRAEVEAYERNLYQRTKEGQRIYANFDEWFQRAGCEDPAAHGTRKNWHRADFDDSGWKTMRLPTRWQDEGFDFNGVFWFARTVVIPDGWQGQELLLGLGSIDKHDETYVNGEKVGAMAWENPNSWCTPRVYTIPAALTRGTRRLRIAVRVRSHQYHGGMTGPISRMFVKPTCGNEAALPLHGDWRYNIEQNWGTVQAPAGVLGSGIGPGTPNAPYTLFHSRLCPLIPYGIRGFLWYQGESNADEPALYRQLLPVMIDDWRRAWGQGDLPFLLVQLANYLPVQEKPVESKWAELRDAQFAALGLPHTGMAVAIDIGDATDIHPRDKRSVGLRLARWALSRVYGRGGLPSGPLFRGVSPVAGGRLRVAFAFAEGLHTRDGWPVRQIAIAGRDRNFVWAESRIEGETLEVWHPDIPHPVHVRYAWADNPDGCNLVNRDNLPASPFSSDTTPPYRG